LIADEAHNLGAKRALRLLPDSVQYRLALSATPVRHFDETGTQALIDYFGESVYSFTLKDAIGVCLTPYEYQVTPVELTAEEMEEYTKLSSRISQMSAMKQDEENSAVERLLQERSRIVSRAENKVAALSSLLNDQDLKNLKHCFVYASDKDPKQTIDVVRMLQKDKGLYVHQFTEKETRDPTLRRSLLERFSRGVDLQALVAKHCLDEGVDIPATRIGYFLASTTNPRQYIQRRGRLLRMFPGKTHAVISDLIVVPPGNSGGNDATESFGRNLIISELRRVVAFASTARNGGRARESLIELAQRYDVMEILGGGG
jgi:superfamily II DNA or RNA helicase